MEMKIIQDTKNEVLNRREIIAEIEEQILPSRNEIRAKLATLVETDAKALIIEKIDSGFGNPKVTIKANAYDNEDIMNKNEKKHFIKRNFPTEEKKEEEAPATAKEEAKVEEAPAKEEKATETEPAKEEVKTEDAPKEEKKEEATVEETKEKNKVDTSIEETKEEAPTEKKDEIKEEPKKEGEQ